MKLTLTDDEGYIIGSWYLPDEQARYFTGSKQTPRLAMHKFIEEELPVWGSPEEYEEAKKEWENG